MLAMIETLVEYARRGARIIRLDAIAFLWKQVGNNLPSLSADSCRCAIDAVGFGLGGTRDSGVNRNECAAPREHQLLWRWNERSPHGLSVQFAATVTGRDP